MMRISTFKTVLRMRFPAVLWVVLLPALAKSQVGITVVTTQVGNEITADFLVSNFQEILSSQFTIQWNQAVLGFDYVASSDLEGSTTGNFGVTQVQNGFLLFSWANPAGSGVSLNDCEQIFSIKFHSIIGGDLGILVNGSVLPIEVVGGPNAQVLPFAQTPFCLNAGQILGNVFYDIDGNCLKDIGETDFQGWKIKIEQGDTVRYRTTDSYGNYYFYGLPDSYQVSLLTTSDNLWSACQSSQTIEILQGQTTVANFASQPSMACEQLTVDLAAPFLRRCFESTYYVHYCNNGTLDVSNAYVELTLDPLLTYASSSIPFSTSDGQTYTFPVGDLQIGDCGYFAVNVLVSCDAVFGQTHCSEAKIFPSEICQPYNPLWDGSILKIKGACDGDSVRFSVANSGDAMPFPVDFIVIEDDMVNFEGTPIQLGPGESTSVAVPANGSTWRMELNNEEISPFNASTASSVEGCGLNNNGDFSIGYVTQFPQDDNTPFTDIDCQPNVDSYDPNDKTGYPNGFCAAHFIESGQEIEYRIRFQNTGTAPAINIVVQDTLPLTLDPATVQPGASSHPYTFELLGNGVIRFSFPDIMLPDSTTDEPGSHGFVNFTVAQASGNTNGTVINNQAAIYFDFNAPVYTNTYTHTVADDFVQSAGTDGNLSFSGYVHTWYGAPVADVEVTLVPTCPVYTDSDGYFEFLQLDTADYGLLPNKLNLDKQEGVTVLDVLSLYKYVNGITPLPFLGQKIAGDLNNSGTLSAFDLAPMSAIVLDESIANVAEYWKFIIEHPFYDNLNESVDSAQITAVKPGNTLDESMVDSSAIKPHFYFHDKPVVNGLMAVEMKVNGLEQFDGLQLGLQWDPNVMQFFGMDSVFDVRLRNTVPGKLQFFFLGEGESFPDSAVLLELFFQTNAVQGTLAELALDTSLIDFQVVVENCKLAGATVDNATFQIEIASGTQDPIQGDLQLSLSPNPIKAGQPIYVQTKAMSPGEYYFQLLDAKGALVRQWSENIVQHQPDLTMQSPLVKGLYVLKAVNAKGSNTARFVVY